MANTAELWTWTFYPRGITNPSNTLDCFAPSREAAHASALRWLRKENARRRRAKCPTLRAPTIYDMRREADRYPAKKETAA